MLPPLTRMSDPHYFQAQILFENFLKFCLKLTPRIRNRNYVLDKKRKNSQKKTRRYLVREIFEQRTTFDTQKHIKRSDVYCKNEMKDTLKIVVFINFI